MKTVAAISFRDNHSLTMDVEGVRGIELGNPTQLDENCWVCEMIIRSDNGVIALNLVAESPEVLEAGKPRR